MNQVVTLFRSASVAIERFSHPADEPVHDADDEITSQVAVNFVEAGSFAILQEKTWWSFEPSDVLVSVPAVVRRYRHPRECPDDVCLSVSFAPEAVEDAVGDARILLPHPRLKGGPTPRFTHSLVTSALVSGDALTIEQAAFHCTLTLSDRWQARPVLGRSTPAHARAIRRAIEFMSARLTDPCSLTLVAREVGMSPFHFARLFSELVAESPHRFLLRLRLRHAATMLRAGAGVTTAALASGFENLSHFSRSFRRRYGVSPRDYPSRRT
jgi:AraC family transcriptional regulator